MGYLFRIILKYKNGFLTKKIRFFDKNFERLQEGDGEIRAELERKGTPIGPLDMMIAGHSRSLGYTVVTNNIKEFARIDGLRLENWVDS